MKRSVWLWVLQGLLALLFLFAGGSKLVMSVEFMQQGPVKLAGWFLHFIGVAEMAGGLGLVLPGIFGARFKSDPVFFSVTLTRLAAIGLIVIMVGAVGISAYGTGVVSAIFPLVVGLLLGVVIVMRGQTGPATS